MTEPDYIKAFQALAKELHKNTAIELLGYHTFRGLSASAIELLEQQYHCQLDDTIRRFYQQSNGLQLRWIFKNNPHYTPKKFPPFQAQSAPVPWNYMTDNFEQEDGCILLLPLEQVLKQSIPPDFSHKAIVINQKSYTPIDFYAQIRAFDAFSYYCKMGLMLQTNEAPLVFLGDEQGTCFTDSRTTTFATYLDFLIASKGLCQRRSDFFRLSEGFKAPIIIAIPTQLTSRWTLKQLELAQHFPLADHMGSVTKHVETHKMQLKAYNNIPLSSTDMNKIIEKHHQFLNTGGEGGAWQVLIVGGRTFGMYKNKLHDKGQQATLDLQHINAGINTQSLNLPYASWCGCYAKGQNFSKAILTGSLMTDAQLEKTDFSDAILKNVDFSRANLSHANFSNADLRGADFENCILTQANFKGALLDGSQFKGALFNGVIV